jgi:hypothetical protein
VVDGPARSLGRLTGHGDDLDDLLGAEGGRLPGPGGVVEEVLQGPAELRRGLLLLGAVQRRCRLPPAVAPGADRHTGPAQLAGHRLDAGVVRQVQKDRRPLDPALVGGLLAPNPLQDGPLCRGDLDRGRSWSFHQFAPSARAGTIRSEPNSMVPPMPDNDYCRLVLVG